MNTVKYVRVQNQNGSFSSNIPIGAQASNVFLEDGTNLEQEIINIKSAVGSPLVASTVAGMTDQTKIYVYTGSETGYTAGNWYYHDGTAWTDGGVYNSVAVNTDTTLSVSGAAADAKKTGDEIIDLKDAIRQKNLLSKATVLENNYWNKSGWHSSNNSMLSYDNIPVVPGSSLLVTGMSVAWFSDSRGGGFKTQDKSTYIGGVTLKNNQIIDVPENAGWFYMSVLKTDRDNVMLTWCEKEHNEINDLKKSLTFFNKRTVEYGKGLNSDGTISDAGSYSLSGYITVEPDSYYIVNCGGLEYCNGFYDKDMQFIGTAQNKSYASYSTPYMILTPPNAKYIRLCFYASYIDRQGIMYAGPAKDRTIFVEDTVTLNKSIAGNGGTIEDVNGYYCSDYIPVLPDSRYLISKPVTEPMWRANAVYDENRELIGTLPASSGLRNGEPYILTTGKDVRYMRIIGKRTDLSDQDIKYYGINPDVEKYAGILDQMNRSTYVSGVAQTDPLVLLWFTDLHNDFGSLLYISEFYKRFPTMIDDVLSTGDMVEVGTYGHLWYGSYTIFDNILQGIGNHECFDANYNTPYTSQNVYDMQIADYIDNWDVTQPENAASLGLNYWYKDYTNQGIKLIMLDCMFWTESQLIWFKDVLESARLSGKHVIVANHYVPGFVDAFDTTHTTKMISNPTYPDGYGTTLNPAAASAVQDFIDAGGTFVCWLSGHTHYDIMGTLHDYPSQVSITLATAMSRVQTYNDTARTEIANQQTFDLLGIDTYRKVIKIARVGCQYDIYLRYKGTVAIDYGASAIM